MRTQSDSTIRLTTNHTTDVRVNQVTRTSQDIDADFELLKSYYAKAQSAQKILDADISRLHSHINYLYYTRNIPPTKLSRESGYSRNTIYKIIGKGGGGKRD